MNYPGTAPLAISVTATPKPAPERRLPRYAPTIQRFAGFLCDVVILALVWAAASELFYAVLPDALAWLATAFFGLLYVLGFVAVGVTPGSWIVGIRIVERYGRRPGLLRALKKSLVPPLIWVATAFLLLDSNSPIQQVDFFLETHERGVGALLGALLLATFAIAVLDLIQSQSSNSSFPGHDDFSGTRVVQIPTRFWASVRMLALESIDWVQRSRPWASIERSKARSRAAEQRWLAAQEVKRAAEEEQRLIAAREAQERDWWPTIYWWIDNRTEAEQDRILDYLTERKKRRQ